MFQGRHFQNAYVVSDIGKAITEFRNYVPGDETGIVDIDLQVQTPEGPRRIVNRVAMIWVGDLQYEIIEPVIDETGIYGNHAGGNGTFRFHHTCRRVDDWHALKAQLSAQSLPVVMERTEQDYPIKFLYVDARPLLGHYLEYCWMSDEMWSYIRGA